MPGAARLASELVLFQSAPPTEVRGDPVTRDNGINVFNVSIRSPHRSEGRFSDGFSLCHKTSSFNPLPPPK